MHLGKNKSLRIAFFLHDLRGGGVERISVHLANELCKMGHSVDIVLVNRTGNPAYFSAIDQRIDVRELAQTRTLTSAIGFRSFIKMEKPDLVISALTHINVSTLLATMFLSVKPHVIVVEHNHRMGRFSRGEAIDISQTVRLAFRLAPWLYGRAETIGAVSRGAREGLARALKRPESEILVLNNPVPTPATLDAEDAKAVLSWVGKKDDPYILGVGALSYEKNFDLLIKAFAQLRKSRKARLVIAGEGPMRAALEKAAEDTGFGEDILLPGFISDPFTLMRHASVFALTSRWEGLPTVLIEAMSIGVSVVSTDCPSGPAEILQDGALGRLVPMDNVDAFSSALDDAIEVPQDIEILRKRASDFQPEKIATRYLEAYLGSSKQLDVEPNSDRETRSAA